LSDPKGFNAFVEKAPQVVPRGEVHFDSTAAPSGDTLNSETLFACKQLGSTPEEVKKYGLQEDR